MSGVSAHAQRRSALFVLWALYKAVHASLQRILLLEGSTHPRVLYSQTIIIITSIIKQFKIIVELI